MNRQLLIGRFSELLGLVPEWGESPVPVCLKDEQTWTSRGSKSRNMISVGEPAEWSLQQNKNDKKTYQGAKSLVVSQSTGVSGNVVDRSSSTRLVCVSQNIK
jgi:hypothetical protein